MRCRSRTLGLDSVARCSIVVVFRQSSSYSKTLFKKEFWKAQMGSKSRSARGRSRAVRLGLMPECSEIVVFKRHLSYCKTLSERMSEKIARRLSPGRPRCPETTKWVFFDGAARRDQIANCCSAPLSLASVVFLREGHFRVGVRAPIVHCGPTPSHTAVRQTEPRR